MTSLFSNFDMNYFYLSLMFFTTFSFFILGFIYEMSMIKIFVKNIYYILESFFYSLKPKMFNKFFPLLIFSFMWGTFYLNFSGVNFYNFAFTSQMSMVLFLSLLFWLSMIIFYVKKNIKGLLFHSIPEGTPIYLTLFLFVIEIISNLIRPVTLSVRLVANILSGHLLMILLFKIVYTNSMFFIFYLLLNTVEMFVSIIQAYIFFTMISLYFSEVV